MQFKHPEILYALFLLLIPIFIHLFQLRRFQKVDFTNVAFLKKVTIQTRKSSQLKKWLTLAMRLLALACIILAFAQPFKPSPTGIQNNKETVIYIDNSFSMQARGANGPLLERMAQDLFEGYGNTENLSWFTNNSERKNSTAGDFKNEILNLGYSYNQLSPAQVLHKAEQLFAGKSDQRKHLIYISDFQKGENLPKIPEKITVDAVQLKPVKITNLSIDTVYIASRNAATIQLKAKISNHNAPNGGSLANIPVALYKQDRLVAKTAVEFAENGMGNLSFDVDNAGAFTGKLELSDPNLPFDNSLYFSINEPSRIKVLTISGGQENFLNRLFDEDRFQFTETQLESLNYNIIPDQNFIVLHGLEQIPAPLATALLAFSDNGGSILVIPSTQAHLGSYNNLLKNLNLGSFSPMVSTEKKVTNIVFSHPLFKDVFEKKVDNFQYPKVNAFYPVSSPGAAALKYEDGSPFLVQSNRNYMFTADLGEDNSNFINSPLVVPSIYNMALQSLPIPTLYYIIGQQNTIAVPAKLGPDEILAIKDSTQQFVPLQQSKANYVMLTTTDEPSRAGNYQIVQRNDFLQTLSFNYDRSESHLQYLDLKDWKGAQVHASVDALFKSMDKSNSNRGFWKWLVIFALLFLIFEMLILKFHK